MKIKLDFGLFGVRLGFLDISFDLPEEPVVTITKPVAQSAKWATRTWTKLVSS